jgi:hypothetical protein
VSFAQDLGVSRITVKSVYEQLVADGYFQAKTGAGTFISVGLDFETFPNIRRPRSKVNPPEIELSDHAITIMSSKASARHGETAPFRPGVPALDKFPIKIWNKYLLDAMACDQRHNLSYGQINGSAALRTSIANHLTDAVVALANRDDQPRYVADGYDDEATISSLEDILASLGDISPDAEMASMFVSGIRQSLEANGLLNDDERGAVAMIVAQVETALS